MGSPVRLVKGYESANVTIPVSLVTQRKPSLLSVQVNAIIEGKQILGKVFEAKDDLQVDITWDGKDTYGRKVIGSSELILTVKYGYQDCVADEKASIKVMANDPNEDSILQWRPSLHHRLRVESQTLHFADGRAFDLALGTRTVKEMPKLSEVEAAVSDGTGNLFYGDAQSLWMLTVGQINVSFISISAMITCL